MGLKVEDIEKLSKIFAKFKKPRKKDPDTIEKMIGIFKDIFPPEKSSVDIIRELRDESLKS
jgi:hypothetical protein